MSITSRIFVLFFVATTFVSGQYLVSTVYEDSQCTVLNGGRLVVNLGPYCIVPEEGCLLTESGLYQIQNCTDNPLTSPTDASFILYQETDNGTCNNGGLYNTALVGPLNVCFASVTTSALKLSGCTAQNSVIVTSYASLADCKKNIATGEQVLVSGKCTLQGQSDAKGICPVSVPVASTPVSATPTSAPQAATPVKKSSNAVYNTIISLVSIATLLVLVCA